MNARQSAQRLVAHALAAGEPIGTVLRGTGQHRAARAAEDGHLARALGNLGFDRALVELAERWPTAVPGALRRLARVPSPRLLLAPLVQVVGLALLFALVQGGLLAVLDAKVVPQFIEVVPALDAGMLGLPRVTLAAVGLGLLGCAGWLAVCGLRGTAPVGGAALRRARHAAVAAATAEAGAPIPGAAAEGATPAELDAASSLALAAATAAYARTLATLRIVVLTALCLPPALTTWQVYRAIASLSTAEVAP